MHRGSRHADECLLAVCRIAAEIRRLLPDAEAPADDPARYAVDQVSAIEPSGPAVVSRE